MTLPAQDIVERALAELDELERYGNATSRVIRPLLSRLTADNEALRKEAEAFRAKLAEACGKLMVAEARADTLAQALRAIVDTLDAEEVGEGPSASEWSKHWQKLHDDARAALGDRP